MVHRSCLKISYLFPKATRGGLRDDGFRIAYFKVHHPEAFAAAYFTFHGSALTTDLIRQSEDDCAKFIERINGTAGAKAKETKPSVGP